MDTTVNYVARYLYKHVTGLVPSGIIGNKVNHNFLVYPNPTQHQLQVKFDTETEKVIRLFTIQGVLVLEETSTNLVVSIPVEGIPAGTYFLQVKEGNKMATQKISIY